MGNRRGRRLVAGASALLCVMSLGGCAQKYRSELVSVNAAGTNSASRESGNFSFTPDGVRIVFDSTSADLVSPNTPSERSLVYVRDLTTSTTRLVSTDAGGTGPANRSASRPVLSPDGTKVAFVSNATNLGPPTDGDIVNDVYVRDLVTNTTTLVSVNAAGTDGGVLESDTPVFSPDGTRIAFRSRAFDLVPTDTNTTYDLFVRDLVAGTTTLVTVDHEGTDSGTNPDQSPPAGYAFGPDSDSIVFASDATNLLADDANSAGDVFVRDLDTGTLRRVSTASDGTAGNRSSTAPVLSPDGAHVVFESFATNLDAGVTDANDQIDLYVKDLVTDETRLVSVNAAGTAAGTGGESRAPVFQPGTSNVAFTSRASNLTTNDTNGLQDIFLRDLIAGTTRLLSVSRSGGPSANGLSAVPVFNADGTRLAFVSSAHDFGTPDTNNQFDVYVKDLPDGVTSLVSFNAAGDNGGNGTSSLPQFQPNGTKIAFVSFASNLVALDHDPDQDIFLASVVPSS